MRDKCLECGLFLENWKTVLAKGLKNFTGNPCCKRYHARRIGSFKVLQRRAAKLLSETKGTR